VGLFTVSFELGEKTREMLMEIASTSVIRFEIGPETRSMIERLASSEEGGGRVVGGLVKKVRTPFNPPSSILGKFTAPLRPEVCIAR
jgi:hypothetical protein